MDKNTVVTFKFRTEFGTEYQKQFSGFADITEAGDFGAQEAVRESVKRQRRMYFSAAVADSNNFVIVPSPEYYEAVDLNAKTRFDEPITR